MRVTFALIFTIVGITLLALDRILDKQRVSALDKKLEHVVEVFPSAGENDYIALLQVMFFPVVAYFFYWLLTSPELPVEQRKLVFIGFLALIIFTPISWFTMGAIMGFRMRKGEDLKTVGCWMLYCGVIMPIFVVVLVSLRASIVLLWLAVYPLKGIQVLNYRWFNSFSGLIGLILAIVGTILQFM